MKWFEEKLGLPPLREVLSSVTVEKLRVLNQLLSRLEKMKVDKETIILVMDLLKIIKSLDEAGTLEKLNVALKEISDLSKRKEIIKFLQGLEKLEKTLEKLAE